MQCDRAQEFFSDYLERTLDRPMTVALEAHLAGCADCREEIEALQATFFALDAVPQVEPPADGAWQVMARLRNERAERYEEERRKAPSFLEWLRALNPLSVAMGASLATLVIGGTLILANTGQHQQLGFGSLPLSRPAVPAPAVGAETPSVQVSYGPVTSTGPQVDVQVTPAIDLPDAQVTLTGGGLPVYQTSWSFKAGTPVPFRVQLPQGAGAQTFRVAVESPRLNRQYHFLVVVPLGARQAPPVNLLFSGQPLEEGLRRVAPYLNRPVVVDGSVDGVVSLQAEGTAPRDCLVELADQVHATVREENGVYRLAAK